MRKNQLQYRFVWHTRLLGLDAQFLNKGESGWNRECIIYWDGNVVLMGPKYHCLFLETTRTRRHPIKHLLEAYSRKKMAEDACRLRKYTKDFGIYCQESTCLRIFELCFR
jgi:hypothetical protein